MSARHQMLGVAAQVAAVGDQGVGGDTALDGEVIQVALDLDVEGGPADRQPGCEGRHGRTWRAAKAVGRSGQGASTGRVGLPSTITAWAASTPAAAVELTISPAST